MRLLLACLFVAFASTESFAGPVKLDRTSVPAAGQHYVHAKISAFGRYAITVQSKQGVAVQLVDKVTGPGAFVGRPGGEDGRIDTFFDRGEYRIVTSGDSRASGKAKVRVRRYKELNPSLTIVETKPIDTTLGDIEQRSYWVDIQSRRDVAFEAAGRNLSDLRLWKDGTWLIDATPVRDTTEPKVGQPMNVFRLVANLEPGLYLLTAYGGLPNKWAEDDQRHPLHLRYGFKQLPTVLRKRMVVGPMGYDRFLVPSANFFRVELKEARPLDLEVRAFASSNPFTGGSRGNASITKKTVPPVAEVHGGGGPGSLVTVRGKAGQAYLLQHFESRWRTLVPDGQHWISSVHAGHAEDNVDATGIILDAHQHHQPTAWQTVELSGDQPWGRRFNLIEDTTVFIEVKEPGSYRIIGGGGARAKYQMEPFLITKPRNYRAPPFQDSGSSFSLDRGLYVLTMRPTKKGIHEVTVSRTGAFFSTLKSLFKSEKATRLPRPTVRFPGYIARPNRAYWLYMNRQPATRVGLVVRSIPLDLREPLAVTQKPKEVVTVPFKVFEEGILYAEAEDGARLDISVDGGPWVKSARPNNGRHEVRIRSGGKHLVSYSLGYRVKRLDPDTPLPKMPDGRIAGLPKFEKLIDGRPRFLDLKRTSEHSYLVQARSPALYRLESTGLLATDGRLRTRVITSLISKSENGIGRNFLVQQYLGTGDYQITVRTRGRTRGHLGMQLIRTPSRSGGRLVDGVPARATMRAGQSLTYNFRVRKAGRYRLRAIGQDRTLTSRLEDADGWPIERVNVPASFHRWFEPGRYRLVVMPESVDVRVVALLEPDKTPVSRVGHGPHALPLDKVIEHVWVESNRAAKRKPESRRRDVWRFEVPAEIDARIELTAKMHGNLVRVDGKSRTKVAYVPPLRGWSGPLPAGSYRLEVLNLHQTSDVPYQVAVRSVQLVVGLTWGARAPVSLPVSVGDGGLVEISSFGSADVEARLLDPQGRTVAKSDDRPDDWNFHLARRLPAGRYTLRIDPVGKRRARTLVTMRQRREHLGKALTVPAKERLVVGRKLHVRPLKIPAGTRFLAAVARSSETLGLVMETKRGKEWAVLGTSVGRPARIEIPLPADSDRRDYRLKLWSADERNLPIDLWVSAVEPQRVTEAELADGIDLEKRGELALGVVEVALERPGTFRTDAPRTRWSPRPSRPSRQLQRQLMHASSDRLWITRTLRKKSDRTLKAERVQLSRGALVLSVGAEPISVDVEGAEMVVARVDAPKTQPGVALLAEGDRLAPTRYDVARGHALSVHLAAERSSARVWAGEPNQDPFDATLRVFPFASPEPSQLGTGSRQGKLPAGRALELALSPGQKRFRVALEEGGVAAVADRAALQRVAWAQKTAETFTASGTRLVLFNPTSEAITYAVDVIPLVEPERPFARPFETRQVHAGRLELQVPAGRDGRRLQTRGAADAVLLHADGRVERGREFLIGRRGGALRVEHDAGSLMAWIDEPNQAASGLFKDLPRRETTAMLPSVVPLNGPAQTLRFKVREPTLVRVRVGSPMLGRWEHGDARAKILVREGGGTFDLYVDGGVGRLALRPIGGGALFGGAEVSATPVAAMKEGLGAEVMVAPGATRAFVFTLKKKGKVGLGVRSDVSDVTLELTTVTGRVLGRGVVQMHELEAGTYLMQLTSPPNAPVARARPALVGLDPPPTGPPMEVVHQYLRSAGYQEERR